MPLSFRLRLTLFFLLIVALPMVALAILVSQIARDSAIGKTDARLSAGLNAATNLFAAAQDEARRTSGRLGAELGSDPATTTALKGGQSAALEEMARALASQPAVTAVRLDAAHGATVSAGENVLVADAAVDLIAPDGSRAGTVTVSTTSAKALLRRIERVTGERAAIIGPGVREGVAGIGPADLPGSGEAVDVTDRDGDELRMATTVPLGRDRVRIALLTSVDDEGFFASEPRVAVALVQVHDGVRSGRRFADALAETDLLPPLAVRMLRVGDEAGDLASVAAHASQFYEHKLGTSLDRLMGAIGPITIVLVSLLIGALVVSIMSALLSITELAL